MFSIGFTKGININSCFRVLTRILKKGVPKTFLGKVGVLQCKNEKNP